MSDEGNLPAAKARLNRAIGAVFDQIRGFIDNQTRWAPSLFTQLEDSIAGITGERSGGAAGVPLWPDALDYRNHIITMLAEWQPRGLDARDRVRLIDERKWRPMDVELIDRISAEMEKWPIAIRKLLYPEPAVSVAAACPSCGTDIVHRPDSAGDIVRQAALQITGGNCVCQKCRASWSSEHWPHLARVLGFNPDSSVLDAS